MAVYFDCLKSSSFESATSGPYGEMDSPSSGSIGFELRK
jgi:hypothetical protein